MTANPRDERGQASLEYVLVGVLLMAMMSACSALWRFFSTGRASEFVEAAASHSATNIGGLFDAFLF